VISTIVAALLPIVVTLMLGFVAGWHQDFDGRQAAIFNRMVMLYALPLNLFAGMKAHGATTFLRKVRSPSPFCWPWPARMRSSLRLRDIFADGT